jgi:hypothetical protein
MAQDNRKYSMKARNTTNFQDLDAWLNYCRFRMIKYDEADLYRSVEYKEWQERRKKRQQWQARNGIVYNKQNRGQ